MNRKLKVLGLALVAVFALTAISASSASAAQFTAGSTTGTVTATQIGSHAFVVNAGTVKCTETSATGTYLSASVVEQTVSPTYNGCTAFGFVNTKIDVNGCTYTLSAAAPTAETGSVVIGCPAGASIVVTAFNCEVTVPAQTVATGVTYHNIAGPPDDLLMTLNLKGMTYIQHSKSFPGCSTTGTNGVATSLHHEGTYVSTGTTVRAFDTTGKQVNLTVS